MNTLSKKPTVDQEGIKTIVKRVRSLTDSSNQQLSHLWNQETNDETIDLMIMIVIIKIEVDLIIDVIINIISNNQNQHQKKSK